MRSKISYVLIALSLFFISSILAQENKPESIPEEAAIFTQGAPPEEDVSLQTEITPAEPEKSPKISAPHPKEQNKISLDIKGMDVVDVFKMLAARSGLNIVVGKNVTGRVALFLKDVDIWDAFEIILLANDLAYEKKGDIINVMTQRDYELQYGERYRDKKQARVVQLKYAKAADLSRALSQIKTNIGRIVVDEGSNTLALIDTPEKLREMEEFVKKTDLPIQTRVFNLNYAQVDKLQTKIQEAITKNLGSIRIDERTNKIAVTDYPQKLDEIAKIINAFDEKTQQVLIDAQIIEIKPKDEFKMGVDWDYWLKKNVRLATSMPTSGAINKLSVGMAAAGAVVGAAGQYKGIVDLLRTIGDIQILSSPRITAVNNQEAKILIGTKEVYVSQTTSQSGTGTEVVADQVNFVDVGIKLYVTPTISRDGFITMKIRPEVSSVKDKYKYGTPQKEIPIVETSEAETTVMIKDGVTIIIGGLKKDKKDKSVSKIPIIGDIPLVGFFFRNTSNSLEKTELVILLTPHILTGDTPYTSFQEIQPKDGAVAKMVKGKIITERISDNQGRVSKETSPEYYTLVTDKVRTLALFDRPKSEKGEIKLAFTLSRDGKLINEPYILETTNNTLNPFAIRVIKSASPFPPFPKFLEKDSETFKISLSYE